MDYKKLISTNYNIKIDDLSLIDSHFGTEIFLAITDTNKFIVKKLPSYMTDVKNEGMVTEHLSKKGIKVSSFLKHLNDNYVLSDSDYYFTVQTFIDGKTFALNSAPNWLLKSSAQLLGEINNALLDCENLPLRFGNDFFSTVTVSNKLKSFKVELERIKSTCDVSTKIKWEEQIKHLEKIGTFDIDTTKLTYANSHGDYNINQLIVNNHDITVVDWVSACKLPVCLEIITSYVFASPKCKSGFIDVLEVSEYINHYTKFFKLSIYDIEMMPFVLYFWHTMCNYHPSEEVSESYKPIAVLISNFSNWLYNNVNILSKQLKEFNNEI